MLPVTQAVSLFGAPLGAAAAPGATAGSALGAGPEMVSGIAAGMIPGAASAAAPAPFADLITEAVGEVQHLEDQAKTSIEGLISGKGVDVHEAMIAAQKAGVGFELVLAVRNKALAAYQQVM